jgi:caffeoyl-CoA O-methyltransferase
MLSLLAEGIEEYVHAHTSAESELFVRLKEETYADLEDPQMQVGRVEGAFLRMMVQLSGAEQVIEIGTFSGYSGLSMASGLPEGGRLVTCDIDPEATAVARRYFDESPWGDKIEIRVGPAIETLKALRDQGARFDLAFIDADKVGYVDYYENILPMMPAGGVILADNTLWSGHVLEPEEDSARALAHFNQHVLADDRVDNVLLSVRDGIMLIRKK